MSNKVKTANITKCNECEFCWKTWGNGVFCVILHATKEVNISPACVQTIKYPLKPKIESANGKIVARLITTLGEYHVYEERITNLVVPSSLNEGKCKFFKKKLNIFQKFIKTISGRNN